MVVTGVRRGELCGLQIPDVNPVRALVHIAFSYVVRGGRRVRKDTKTHQDRWLAIDPVTSGLIVSYLAEIKAGLAAVGAGLRDDAYLFSNDPAHARPARPLGDTGLALTWPVTEIEWGRQPACGWKRVSSPEFAVGYSRQPEPGQGASSVTS